MSETAKINMADMTFCFDLDGTLIDTAPDLVRVLNYLVEKEGLAPVPFQHARNAVGYGARHLIELAYQDNGKDLPAETSDRLLAEFLTVYANTIDELSRPFSGVVETLMRLKHVGAQLNICTNKPGYLARPLMQKLGLSSLFTRIIGSDDAPAKKPDPRHIFCAAGHERVDHIIMVGDSLPDVKAAKNASVLSVMMSYGYSPIPVRGLGGDIILRDFREIPEAVTAHLRLKGSS